MKKPNGSARTAKPIRPMNKEEVERAALTDPTPSRMKRTPQTKIVRRALQLT